MQGMQAAEDKLQQRLAAAESKHRYRQLSRTARGPFKYAKLTYNTHSCQLEGDWLQVERAQNLRHLPDTVRRRCSYDMRPSILQGMHDALVSGT